MVELKNNGDALSCIVLMLDSLAYSNGSTVEIETLHDQGCKIFAHMEDSQLSNEELGRLKPTSNEALNHLYSCNCNTGIEAVFAAHNGETLLVPFKLSQVVERHPWLEDGERTKELLSTATEHGASSPLMGEDFHALKLQFGERRGFANAPSREEREALLPPELVDLMRVDPNGTIH